jgi:hypothetical protein
MGRFPLKNIKKSFTLPLRDDKALCKILQKTTHISSFILGQSVLEN